MTDDPASLGSRLSRSFNAMKEVMVVVSIVALLFPGASWYTKVGIFAGGSIIAIAIGLYTTRLQQIDEPIPDEDAYLEAPAREDLLRAANHHARRLYGKDAIDFEKVRTWWERNPFVFGILRDGQGAYLGYFDLLPLTDSGIALVSDGKHRERDLMPEHIMPPLQMNQARTLYLAGIAVKGAGTEIGRNRTSMLLGGMIEYVERIYGRDPLRLLAIAATPQGEKLLKRARATIANAAPSRRDHHDLYELAIDGPFLDEQRRRARRRRETPELRLLHPLHAAA